VRDQLDRYYTPDKVATALGAVTENIKGRVLEPHVGGGAFAGALAGQDLTVGDVDPAAPGLDLGKRAYVGDFLDYNTPHDWVIGNPPYKQAEEHIRHALELAPCAAFHLRLAFLESVRRKEFWDLHPPLKVWVLRRRPSFTGGGTDGCAYGWFIWDAYQIRAPQIGWVSW